MLKNRLNILITLGNRFDIRPSLIVTPLWLMKLFQSKKILIRHTTDDDLNYYQSSNLSTKTHAGSLNWTWFCLLSRLLGWYHYLRDNSIRRIILLDIKEFFCFFETSKTKNMLNSIKIAFYTFMMKYVVFPTKIKEYILSDFRVIIYINSLFFS